MHIEFKRLSYKNILSTGNVETEIFLNKHKTTLISGQNGSGKSTVEDALVFALYGKPFRKINKPQLINSINQKDLLVEIEFSISDTEYKICRGIKPNIFEIWKDGELLNKDAASRDYQQYLEDFILKMNMKSFTQIVILGSATFVPFMELTPAVRREIIEDLLDIQIFSTMNLLLKDKISENKSSLSDVTHSFDIADTKLNSLKETNDTIRRMKSVELDKLKEKVSEYLTSIDADTREIRKLELTKEELASTIGNKSNVISKIDKLKSLKIELDLKCRMIEKELSFYRDHDSCPTCSQDIEVSFKEHTIKEKKSKLDDLLAGIRSLEGKLSDESIVHEGIQTIEEKIRKINLQIGDHSTQIRIAKNALLSYKTDLVSAKENTETEIDQKKVDDLVKQLSELSTVKSELLTERELLAITSNMLKDGGIKTMIVKQYIPVINRYINSYLEKFELFVDFQLDENFNEVIKSRYRDAFSYSSFSEGEKLRISLAIMLTWRAVSKLRNSVSTNLMLLDETLDGSLDAVGIENLMDTFNDLGEMDNIFVISHRGIDLQDKFDCHLRFEKVKNFSRLAVSHQ